jgi:tetratricopeptide (TPR) repeat protein
MLKKMKNVILLYGLLFVVLASFVFAASCEPKTIKEMVTSAEANEKAAVYSAAAADYGTAADCSDYNKEYDDAIKYEQKAAEMYKKAGIFYGHSQMLLADYYSKKGNGFENNIREHCDIGQELFIEKIDKELQSDKPCYSCIYSDYGNLAVCYKLVNDTKRSCDYCLKQNEYEKKAGRGDKLTECEYYGCTKNDSKPTNIGGSSNPSEGFSIWYLILGIIVLLILITVFFFSKKINK